MERGDVEGIAPWLLGDRRACRAFSVTNQRRGTHCPVEMMMGMGIPVGIPWERDKN